MSLQADITFLVDDNFRVSAKHVALLEAVGRSGSIAAAARCMNLSYKAAWDALGSMQHLTQQPLLHKNTGGRGGGGTKLAPAGLKLIEVWYRLQSGFADLLKQAEQDLYGCDVTARGTEQFSAMRTSARNIFVGQVAEIIPLSQSQDAEKALLSDVCLDLGDNLFIHSAITSKSVERLGLMRQRPVHALVKASFVEIMPLEHFPKSGNRFLDQKCGGNTKREQSVEQSETKTALEKSSFQTDKNRLCGTICDFIADDQNTEITVDLGQAKTITATCLKEQALQAGLRHGLAVAAQFSPADVILATS